jgi:hypothetical protein
LGVTVGRSVDHYVGAVRGHAYRVTDEDVDRLRGAGLDDDAIFELTVAAALGAAAERLQVGFSLLGRELWMRLGQLRTGCRRIHRVFLRLTRALGAELDDVGKAARDGPPGVRASL